MEYTTLGRTGLKVSVAGLGCGGTSRLGLGTGGDAANAVNIVHRALDLGVNLIDTAQYYDTETIVGKAIERYAKDMTRSAARLIEILQPDISTIVENKHSSHSLTTTNSFALRPGDLDLNHPP